MARKLSKTEAAGVKWDETTRYPWDEWTNGDTYELKQGEDFNGRVPQFRSQCNQVAKRRGLTASVLQNGDKVYVKFTKLQSDDAAGTTGA